MENIAQDARSVTRRELFELLRSRGSVMDAMTEEAKQHLLEFVLPKISITSDENLKQNLLKDIRLYCYTLVKRWKDCHGVVSRFKKNNEVWLDGELTVKLTPEVKQSKSGRGRPKLPFSVCSSKSKARHIQNLLKSNTPSELSYAAASAYRRAGQRNVAELITCASTSHPSTLKRIKKATSEDDSVPTLYSPEQALALLVDLKLSRHQYISLRDGAKERNVYPPYYTVLEAKNKCYPDESSIIINDTLAEIKLQPLVDHTAVRLAEAQEDVYKQVLNNIGVDAKIITVYKWGCDGSGGHSQYKQKFSESSEFNQPSDADILMTSLVPLQSYVEDQNSKIILWQSPRTSSTRFCRPIRFQYIKETATATAEEFSHIETQIQNLVPTQLVVDSKIFLMHHELVKTMVDGKVCNAMMNNSSQQVCYICGASPKDMNNLDLVRSKPCNKSAFAFGLSTLHAHIRFFECLLHISYKLKIKKWQARGQDEKENVEKRKKAIQQRFRSEMHLLVDIPKQGCGTTNDGNTSRRFFSDPKNSAEITGIDLELINRFSVILSTLSSGYAINIEPFRQYLNATASLYVELYPWFYMPASIHKILIHGADVIHSMILPIGQLSEDVQEARHKEYRHYREHHTRKMCRTKTNEDILHNLLISSDPLISSIRKLPVKNTNNLSSDVLSLLFVPEQEINQHINK